MTADFQALLPAPVLEALEKLERAGHAAYLAGGCVRDLLRGIPPHDYDLTTDALPEQTAEVFSAYPVIPTGVKHGTVTVLLGDLALEITTFRTDGTYSDGRRPDEVRFTRTIEEDLRRRDFTVNAMAWSPYQGLADPYGGREDLQNRLLRCVGKPEERFSEDALRILRGARFASCLGFTVEAETERAMLRLTPALSRVSAERISAEFLRLLCGQDAERILLRYRELIAFFLPELRACFDFEQHTRHHCYDVYTHIVKVVSAVSPTPTLRLAALLHDVAKPACFVLKEGKGHFPEHPEQGARLAEAILRRLRIEKKRIREVCLLIRMHDAFLKRSPAEAAPDLLRAVPPELVGALLELMEADAKAKAEPEASLAHVRALREAAETLRTQRPCLSLQDLAIGGDVLLAIGVPPGPGMGKLLQTLLEKVSRGELENTPEALLDAAKKSLTGSYRCVTLYKNKD